MDSEASEDSAWVAWADSEPWAVNQAASRCQEPLQLKPNLPQEAINPLELALVLVQVQQVPSKLIPSLPWEAASIHT